MSLGMTYSSGLVASGAASLGVAGKNLLREVEKRQNDDVRCTKRGLIIRFHQAHEINSNLAATWKVESNSNIVSFVYHIIS